MDAKSRNEKGRRILENELHVELLPGTEIMTDIGNYHFVKGSHHDVLIPQPSDDPHDPLNWSAMWKTACIANAALATFSQGFGPLALAPMFPALIESFKSDLAGVVQFTGVCILVLGFSNFIWVPISSSFGRRPVYLISQLINLGTSIWRARATSYASFMGASIVNGLAAGPSETIMPAVIADIFFLNDRGKWNTLYWVVYMGSLMVGPIISGSMTATVGWRYFWWLNTAIIALSFLSVFFLFPETKFSRILPSDTPSDKPGSSSDAHSFQESAEQTLDTLDYSISTTSAKPSGVHISTTEAATKDPYLHRGSPGKWQWRLFQPNANPFHSIFLDLWTPWKLFAFPIVEFTAFVVSWACSSFLVINLTQSQVLAAPPYNMTPLVVGFTNFAILIGAFIGLFTAGPLSDFISARSTRKNNGIREPEMRLPAMIPYVIIMLIGNIVTSVGYQRHWPWEVIVLIGYTSAGITVASLPGIVSTYAVDSYKPVAGSLFVAITVNKNVWGYGLSKFITPWSIEDGFISPIMTNASLTLLFCLFGVVFWWKGKMIRRWSKDSSVHRM